MVMVNGQWSNRRVICPIEKIFGTELKISTEQAVLTV